MSCSHSAKDSDISDHHCRACGVGIGVVARDLRARIGALRSAMRDIQELAHDGNALGHNNYVAILQAAQAARGEGNEPEVNADWRCKKCGEELHATMGNDIRCKNMHVASGPCDYFLKELRAMYDEITILRDAAKESADRLFEMVSKLDEDR